MYFKNSNGMSTNPNQDFVWVAEYLDGKHLLEFDRNGKENSFYAINKDQLIRYGLVGCGHKMYFDVINGIFNVSGRTLELEYIDQNDVKYNLTGANVLYNDILQFKEAESVFNPSASNGGIMETTVNLFNFGYKQKLFLNGIHFNLKVICKVPYNNPVYLEITLTSDQSLNGRLILRRNGKIIDAISAPLTEGMKGTLNWNIL